MSGIIQIVAESVIIGLIGLHPIHISVCDIEYDPPTQALQVTHRLFLDDLESAINTRHGLYMDIAKPEDMAERDSLVQHYLLSNFEVSVDGRRLEKTFIGVEIVDDVLYGYIEIVSVKKFKQIRVTDSVLMELFDDQVNLVHVKYNNKTRSLKLEKNSEVGVITYREN